MIPQNLGQVGLSEDWLREALTQRGISDPAQVVLASLDTKGRLYVDRRHDELGTAIRPGDRVH